MIPLRDYVPTRRFAVVTLLLLLINIALFVFELLLMSQGKLDSFLVQYGVVPARLLGSFSLAEAFTLISSMFLHGGIMHVAGNMLYLWIFGNNVEDTMGRLRFIIFYFLTGFAATLLQVFFSRGSEVPGIGASGAIAGVLAAYLVLFPKARVATLIPLGFFARVANLPAIIVLGFWFVLQLLNGVLSIGGAQAGGVAWFAHIGGFVAGLILVLPFSAGRRRLAQY